MLVQHEEAKLKIIETARSIFSIMVLKDHNGRNCQATRKGKSSIYYYFENKEDIFRLLLRRKLKNQN